MAARNQKKIGKITAQDVCNILQRYSEDTILILLREIANQPNHKINWNLVAKTINSRVTNPRELQPRGFTGSELRRLWRHLAYRQPLIDGNNDDGDGDDGDSDLEFELEVSDEPILKEVINCVKKLAYGDSSVNKKSKDKLSGNQLKSFH